MVGPQSGFAIAAPATDLRVPPVTGHLLSSLISLSLSPRVLRSTYPPFHGTGGNTPRN